MIRFRKTLVIAGAVAALSLAAEARAGFVLQVTATLNTPSGSTQQQVIGSGQSTITLDALSGSTVNQADVDLGSAAHPIHETFGTTTVASTNAAGSDAFNAPYTWTLTFTHVVNGNKVATSAPTPATATVSGTFGGNLSANGSTVDTHPTLAGTAMTVDGTNKITVDGRDLLIRLDPFTPPGTPPSSIRDFSVAIINASEGSFQPVPEPATLALVGVGGLLLLAPRLRRSLRSKATA